MTTYTTSLIGYADGRLFWTKTPCDRNLISNADGKIIRKATWEEVDNSLESAAVNGLPGIIQVEIDGELLACYCD